MPKRKNEPPPRMRVIVLANRKGGVGKTTLACNLAVEAERSGAGPVGIIDTDPMQGLAKWWDARAHVDSPTYARPARNGGLAPPLAELDKQGCRYVLVDTPPAVDAGVAATLQFADLVLVPVQPSPDDLRAVGSTVELAERCKRPMVFILNRCKPRVRLTGQAAIALSQHGTVAPVQVADRASYASSKIDGRTAPELGGAAADEMEALWDYIEQRVAKLA